MTGSLFSLRNLRQRPVAHGGRWVNVSREEIAALCDAVDALDALYEDEWRCTVDWGNTREREQIRDRAAAALGHFKERGMDA